MALASRLWQRSQMATRLRLSASSTVRAAMDARNCRRLRANSTARLSGRGRTDSRHAAGFGTGSGKGLGRGTRATGPGSGTTGFVGVGMGSYSLGGNRAAPAGREYCVVALYHARRRRGTIILELLQFFRSLLFLPPRSRPLCPPLRLRSSLAPTPPAGLRSGLRGRSLLLA
jgi:hypothetical protein